MHTEALVFPGAVKFYIPALIYQSLEFHCKLGDSRIFVLFCFDNNVD